MSKIMTITLHERVGRDDIAAMIARGENAVIEIKSDYAELLAPDNLVVINGLTGPEQTAIYNVLDQASYLYEGGAFVVVVDRVAKSFSLANSFVRNSLPVIKPLTDLPDGTVVKARFEIPGFGENEFREIVLYYNMAFNPADVSLLTEIGVVLTGDGREFEIENDTACRVTFSKPGAATDVYVIDDKGNQTIIER